MRARAFALLACCLLGCGDDAARDKLPAAPPEPAALTREKAVDPAVPAPAAEQPAKPALPPSEPWIREGFAAISIRDEVPLCVFSDYEAHHKVEFFEQITRQKLKADSPVVIGAFGPWCVNEACDDRPSLQCSVERDGSTLIVHSRYWGARKKGPCKDGACRPVTAGCLSPALEAGDYTVQHGSESFPFRVPGVLRRPCFGDPLTPPGL